MATIPSSEIIAELAKHPYKRTDKVQIGGSDHYVKVFVLGTQTPKIIEDSGNPSSIAQACDDIFCVGKKGIVVDGTTCYVLKETTPCGTFKRAVVFESSTNAQIVGVVDNNSVQLSTQQGGGIKVASTLPNGGDFVGQICVLTTGSTYVWTGSQWSSTFSAISEDESYTQSVEETKTFVVGSISSASFPNTYSSANRACIPSVIQGEVGTTIKIDCGANYDYVVFTSSSATSANDWTDSGWKNGGTEVSLSNQYVAIIVRTSSSHTNGQNANITADDISEISASVISYTKDSTIKRPYGFKNFTRKNSLFAGLTNPFSNRGMYYYHIGRDVSGSDVVIPCQSLDDVNLASRLGFKVYEVNTIKCSDGFLMHHGASETTFASNCVIDGNGNYANNVDVSSLTLAQVKATYKFKSKYTKYERPIPSLKEGLNEIKKMGMIPLISLNSTYAGEIRDISKEVFGDGYIAYQGNTTDDNALIMEWSSISTKSGIVARCESVGSPFLIMPTTSVITSWLNDVASDFAGETITDAKTYFNNLSYANQISLLNQQVEFFADIAEAVHNKNCLIGWAASYIDEPFNQLLILSGWDASAAKNQVNIFDSPNVANINLDGDASTLENVETTASISNGTIVFDGGYKYLRSNLGSYFASKGVLKIRFSGTLYIQLYGGWAEKYVSDGTKEMVFSSYYLDKAPYFNIYTESSFVGTTTIYDLQFVATKA